MNLVTLNREQLEASLLPSSQSADESNLHGTGALPPPSLGHRRGPMQHVLTAAHAALTRVARHAIVGRQLSNAAQMQDLLTVLVAGAKREAFLVIFLDARSRAITVEEMFTGVSAMTVDWALWITNRAVEVGAATLACARFDGNTGEPAFWPIEPQAVAVLRGALDHAGVGLASHLFVDREHVLGSMAEVTP